MGLQYYTFSMFNYSYRYHCTLLQHMTVYLMMNSNWQMMNSIGQRQLFFTNIYIHLFQSFAIIFWCSNQNTSKIWMEWIKPIMMHVKIIVFNTDQSIHDVLVPVYLSVSRTLKWYVAPTNEPCVLHITLGIYTCTNQHNVCWTDRSYHKMSPKYSKNTKQLYISRHVSFTHNMKENQYDVK